MGVTMVVTMGITMGVSVGVTVGITKEVTIGSPWKTLYNLNLPYTNLIHET